uniref:IGFBP N-terminal domain-containing protein n=1 Tax=Globodera pallida TaxID=36090 RepID=A0A183CKX7_GLOPA
MSFLNALPILLTILFGIVLQNGHFADASCCCCCKPCCCGCTCVGPCQCCNPPLLIKLPRTCPCCCKCCCCKPCCCGGCCCGCCGGGGGRKKRSIVLRSAIEVAKTGKPASPAVKMVASSCRRNKMQLQFCDGQHRLPKFCRCRKESRTTNGIWRNISFRMILNIIN